MLQTIYLRGADLHRRKRLSMLGTSAWSAAWHSCTPPPVTQQTHALRSSTARACGKQLLLLHTRGMCVRNLLAQWRSCELAQACMSVDSKYSMHLWEALRLKAMQGATAGALQRQLLTRAKRRSRSAGALCARSVPPQGSAISAEYTRKSV